MYIGPFGIAVTICRAGPILNAHLKKHAPKHGQNMKPSAENLEFDREKRFLKIENSRFVRNVDADIASVHHTLCGHQISSRLCEFGFVDIEQTKPIYRLTDNKTKNVKNEENINLGHVPLPCVHRWSFPMRNIRFIMREIFHRDIKGFRKYRRY